MSWAPIFAAGSILDPLYRVLGQVMSWLYSVIPSYGVAIVLVTVVVRLILAPLTHKQTQSMQAMQTLQPEMKRLQQKYKNDRQKQQEELMKLYKEHGVNPAAGCLPLVLQMPVFIVLYRLILDLTKTALVGAVIAGGTVTGLAGDPSFANLAVHSPQVESGHVKSASLDADVAVNGQTVGKLAGAKVTDDVIHGAKKTDPVRVVDAKGNPLGTIAGARLQDGHLEARPKHIPKNGALHQALSRHPGKMVSWGIDLAKRPAGVHGLAKAWPYYLLILLVVLTGYYQQRQMTSRTQASAQANPQQQMMSRIFPLFFAWISYIIDAGVTVYFLVSNVWQIAQQAWVFRGQDAAATGNGVKGGGKSGGKADKGEVQKVKQPKNSGRQARRKKGK